ncbi:glycerophosphoryl diester phosphodiesterase [Clostridia bacterium]|nr:glycerophosphoryl diester phosphodiesterase [Clostridia bacterium]
MSAQVWAHRGDSSSAPENTLPAFSRAVELGADGVELDVQRTLDGVAVVSHDDTISRCSNGSGAISELTLAVLRRYEFTCGKSEFSGTTIPTLEDVLRLIEPSSLQINIELKKPRQTDPGLVPAVLDLTRAAGMMERVVFSSFDISLLERTRALAPDARLGLLFGMRQRAPWEAADSLHAEAMHAPLARARIGEFVKRCHDQGLQVRLWTVDAPAAIERAMRSGVDGVITNRPGLAMRIRSVVDLPQ